MNNYLDYFDITGLKIIDLMYKPSKWRCSTWTEQNDEGDIDDDYKGPFLYPHQRKQIS